jgi:glycosyltransferase involved in cell wall biosynthesis
MLLTIIVPSHNHERFVISTIKAATQINVKNKEIIVIDDGSSDTSAHTIREYIATKDNGCNIRLIARENRGLVKTLNEGLSIALGKYFYLVGSDDIPIPAGISSLVNYLEANGDLQFALGNALFMNSENQRTFTPSYGAAHQRFFALSFDRRKKEIFLNYPHPILLQATVFKTSTLKNIGGWREDIISDDFSLFLRLFSQLKSVDKDFAYQPDIMACFYRQHETNIFRNSERQFMMMDQTLTLLCPAEYRDAAHLKLLADIGIMVAKRGDLSLALHLFNSTIARIGIIRSMRASGPALRDSLMTRITNRLSRKIVVEHEPAASITPDLFPTDKHETLYSQTGS